MEKGKNLTIYDLAKSMNVSPSTVSRALNDDPAISKKTRKKVFETAAKMGYRSNHFARNLRQSHSLTIGVLIHELNAGFVAALLSGIEKVASEAGYGIIIMDSMQSAEKETANAESLFHRRVDGIIAIPAPDTNGPDHFSPFLAGNTPFIFLDHAASLPKSTSIVIDNARCGYLATRHLIGQGCRRIVHLTPSIGQGVYADRYNGYRTALRESGLPFDAAFAILAPPTEEHSAAAAQTLLQIRPMPDGLFVTNDLAAAVCVRTLLDQGIRVPEDIAVVGFNNDLIGKLIRPTLTTINYPAREMGETAAKILVNHLKGIAAIDSISTMTVRAELIVRQSSLKKDHAPGK